MAHTALVSGVDPPQSGTVMGWVWGRSWNMPSAPLIWGLLTSGPGAPFHYPNPHSWGLRELSSRDTARSPRSPR